MGSIGDEGQVLGSVKAAGWFWVGISLYGASVTHLKTLVWAVPQADAVNRVHGTLSLRDLNPDWVM